MSDMLFLFTKIKISIFTKKKKKELAVELHEIKSFCTVKETITEMRRVSRMRENLCKPDK